MCVFAQLEYEAVGAGFGRSRPNEVRLQQKATCGRRGRLKPASTTHLSRPFPLTGDFDVSLEGSAPDGSGRLIRLCSEGKRQMQELDLHGHTVDEALSLFVDFYNRQVRRRSEESLRIIHGYGSTKEAGEGGKIRRKIRAILAGAAGSLDWRPGEDVEGNPGITMVFPRKVLQPLQDELSAAILTFCSIPRTESKVAGEFRKHAPREIKQAIRALVRQGQLRTILKGDRETYVN